MRPSVSQLGRLPQGGAALTHSRGSSRPSPGTRQSRAHSVCHPKLLRLPEARHRWGSLPRSRTPAEPQGQGTACPWRSSAPSGPHAERRRAEQGTLSLGLSTVSTSPAFSSKASQGPRSAPPNESFSFLLFPVQHISSSGVGVSRTVTMLRGGGPPAVCSPEPLRQRPPRVPSLSQPQRVLLGSEHSSSSLGRRHRKPRDSPSTKSGRQQAHRRVFRAMSRLPAEGKSRRSMIYALFARLSQRVTVQQN